MFNSVLLPRFKAVAWFVAPELLAQRNALELDAEIQGLSDIQYDDLKRFIRAAQEEILSDKFFFLIERRGANLLRNMIENDNDILCIVRRLREADFNGQEVPYAKNDADVQRVIENVRNLSPEVVTRFFTMTCTEHGRISNARYLAHEESREEPLQQGID